MVKPVAVVRPNMPPSHAGRTSGRPHVVALAGSLRDASVTRVAVRRALAGAEAEGATTELLDLREFDLPPLDPDRPAPEDARRLARTVREADAVVLGTPVYHHSYAGVLKNALDYLGFDEFEDTTVGIVAAAGGGAGGFPSAAVDHLRGVAFGVHAEVRPNPVVVTDSHGAVADGAIVDAGVAERLETLGADLAASATTRSVAPAGKP